MDLIRLYIATGELPNDRGRAHKIQIQSARFSLVDGQLYKRSLGGPYLKCLTPSKANMCWLSYTKVYAEITRGEEH